VTVATIARAPDRLQCQCGTRQAPRTIKRDMGRSKSYRAECPGCGKRSAPTFYIERLDDKWNEVASR